MRYTNQRLYFYFTFYFTLLYINLHYLLSIFGVSHDKGAYPRYVYLHLFVPYSHTGKHKRCSHLQMLIVWNRPDLSDRDPTRRGWDSGAMLLFHYLSLAEFSSDDIGTSLCAATFNPGRYVATEGV